MSMLSLEVPGRTRMVHEEHHGIMLEPDFYRITRQPEDTPEKIREVEE